MELGKNLASEFLESLDNYDVQISLEVLSLEIIRDNHLRKINSVLLESNVFIYSSSINSFIYLFIFLPIH